MAQLRQKWRRYERRETKYSCNCTSLFLPVPEAANAFQPNSLKVVFPVFVFQIVVDTALLVYNVNSGLPLI